METKQNNKKTTVERYAYVVRERVWLLCVNRVCSNTQEIDLRDILGQKVSLSESLGLQLPQIYHSRSPCISVSEGTLQVVWALIPCIQDVKLYFI